MEQNDQVQEEPVTGDSGEIEKDASKEALDSSTQSSEKKEDTTPTAETAQSLTREADVQEQETNTSGETSETSEKEETPEVKVVTETPETPATKESPEAVETPGANDAPEASETPKASETMAEFDYSTLSREDLVNRLEVLLETLKVGDIRDDVDHIKINFYKKVKQETDQKRKKFVEEGGAIEDFQPMPDALEEKIKVLFNKYRDLKSDYNKNLELEKKLNLRKKYDVIERIKELINSKESINKTFNEFRDLQKEWRSIGLVPQQNLKDLWDTYNHHVEKFYDYIKINKELRDLDLKKNLELKIQLCEKAEELLLESSVVKAFQVLQKYHEQWREIGPVPMEIRTEIWERFREATSKINRKHQQHFEDLKKSQKKNLEQKTLLCEKAEELSTLTLESHRAWDEKSRELIELQKVWKTIGFAPKKDNNKIYERFRTACDTFFNRKREFYARNKENMLNNLQMKTDLCVQAESLKESKEWKKTTEDLINLQQKWKEVGPVPKKHSDAIWKRFRAACDHFFNAKSDHYKNLDKSYSDNLEEKKKLLEEVGIFKMGDSEEDNLRALNEFQRRWSNIGFVPIREKEHLQEQFRQAINARFDQLDINENKRNLLKFKNKVSSILQKPKADAKLDQERERFVNRLQQMKSDIVLWENNIGFFARSKNAESMIEEVQNKIDKAKEAINLLEEKIEMLDNLETE